MTDAEMLIGARVAVDKLLEIEELKDNEKLLSIRGMLIRFLEMPGSKAPPNLLNDMRNVFIYAASQLENKPENLSDFFVT